MPSDSGAARLASRAWRGPWIPIAIALLAHGVGLTGGFTVDDVTDIVGHPVVTGDAPLTDLHRYNYMGEPIGEGANTFRPLQTLLFALEWRIGGGSPMLFHAVSVALFCLLVALVYRYGRGLVGQRAAVAAAALFASLAIHVDAVGLVANSAEVSSLLLGVSALLATQRGRPAVAALAYLAALLAKESAIAIPIIAVAQVFLTTEPGSAERRRGAIAVVAMLASAALFLIARSALLDFDVRGNILPADNLLVDAPLAVRLWMPLVLFGKYLALTVAPLSLSFDYTYSQIPVELDLANPHGWLGLAAALALVAGAAAAWRRRHREPQLARCTVLVVLGLFASYALFSNSVFLIVTLFAERLFLAPSMWLCLLAACVCRWLLAQQPSARSGLLALAALVLLSQTFLAATRSHETRSNEALFAAQVETAPDSVKGRLYHARALARAGQHADALWHLGIAVAGRNAFPAPWSAPRDVDHLSVAERLALLPSLAAPTIAPQEYWRRLRPIALSVLGPEIRPLLDHLATRPRP